LRNLLTGGTAGFWNGQLSLSGGSATTRFLFSAGYTRQTTVFPGDMHDSRVNARINLNHFSTDHRYHFAFASAYSSQQSNLSSYDLSNWVNLPPHIHLYDSTGKLNWSESGSSFYSLGITNPLAYLYQKYRGQFGNLLSNIQTSYQCRNGLSFSTNLGYNLLVTDETRIDPSTSLDPATGQLPFSTFSNRHQWNWIAEPQINYDQHWGLLKLNVMAGATYQYSRDNLFYVNASNYSSDLQLESVSAAGSATTSNNSNEFKYVSGYGRASMNYADEFLLNLSARRDGSSRFGPGKQFANFGSVGIGWIFSKAKWFHSIFSFISFGKIRTSYGTAGNDNIGNYQFLDTWTNTNTTYQGNPGLIPTRLYNPDYSWEVNHKAEIALDLGFLKDRMLFSFQFYNNRCGNQLIAYTLPAAAGFNSVNKNLDALVQNRGMDMRIYFKSMQRENIEWTSQLTVSSGRNKLLRFPGLSQSSYATVYVTGQPLSVRQLYQYKGVDPTTGVYSFEDINQDGLLNSLDKTGRKNTEPQFYGGFTNNLRIKNFEISLFLEFRKQTGLNYLSTQLYNVPGYDFRNQPQIVWNRWQQAGDQKSIQRFTANYSSDAYTKAASYLGDSEAIYGDASFIRCKNLLISWSVPKERLKKIGAQVLRFNVAFQNLFTLTHYLGADPENQNLYALPPLRTMTAGLQLNF
ncbi:MAG: TonB-dependent receptor, partial [Bacteroidetes bacterium]|nr:TonB-dependent receptor [Bacteroidota bacterium]